MKFTNKTVIVVSIWLFILFTYTDEARSNTNQMYFFVLIVIWFHV